MPLNKEQVALVLALLLALYTSAGRLLGGAATAGAVPEAPEKKGPQRIAAEELPLTRIQLLSSTAPGPGLGEGRDPFASADIWEDPVPLPLDLPPEIGGGRALPGITLGGGRVRAQEPARVPSLPAPVEEPDEPAPPPEDAPPAMEGGE